LEDFRLLYEAATDEERADLMRLFTRIDFHGKNANIVATFRDGVNLAARFDLTGVNGSSTWVRTRDPRINSPF
jgi:hypothetical protein